MNLVERKEFAAAALDSKDEIFVVQVTTFASLSSNVHLFRQAQIVSLKTNKVFTAIPNKYVDFADVFLLDLAAKLLEHTKINKHAIDFIDGK